MVDRHGSYDASWRAESESILSLRLLMSETRWKVCSSPVSMCSVQCNLFPCAVPMDLHDVIMS